MSTEEYLSVLVSIVVGLGMSHTLTGSANLLVDRARVRGYWVWGMMLGINFLAHVQFWWSTFGLGEGVAGNFFGFLFFLLTPVALYLMAVLMLPSFDETHGTIDLRAHYFANRQWIFGIGALIPVFSAVRAVGLSGDEVVHVDRLFELLFLLWMLAGALFRGPRVHAVLAVAGFIAFVAMILITSLQPG